jgi:small subunit ribosomal protein S20
MPTHKSNWKRLRQDKHRRARNVARKTALRGQLKRVRQAATTGVSAQEIEGELRSAFSLLDHAAKHNLIHRKNADRNKARLARLVSSCRKSEQS